MSECIVPGCPETGRNKLGVRCRVWYDTHKTKGQGSAVWSPDADAFLCDKHATQGADMTLVFVPNTSGTTTLRVIAGTTTRERTVPIKT